MDMLANHRAGLLVLRVALGSIFFTHGWGKAFGGHSFVNDMLAMVGWEPTSYVIWAIALLEFSAGLALILGTFTRLAASVLAGEMLVAVILFHVRQGFFIVAVPNAPLAFGFEYHVALIGGLVCLVLGGPGILALGGSRGGTATPTD